MHTLKQTPCTLNCIDVDYPLKIRNVYLDLQDRLRWLANDVDVMQWGFDQEGCIHPKQIENIQKIIDNIKTTNALLIEHKNIEVK